MQSAWQRRARALVAHVACASGGASHATAEAAASPSPPLPPAQQAPPDRRAQALVTYIRKHEAMTEDTLQAGAVLVTHTRADVRREFINRLCAAAVAKSALVYAIAPSGGVGVTTPGVYRLTTHPTLSRRAILSAMLRHGANVLVLGEIATRDDVAQLMDAVYTGYHTVAEMYGESAHDALARLEAIGVDTSMLPANLRVVVPPE